jgi:serine/threonine-protein kinase
LLREIGRGSMGVVYEGVHSDLGRPVALKVLLPEQVGQQEYATRMRAEARAIARLDHENLVKLHDFGVSSDGRPFYAMELLHGESLDAYLRREGQMAPVRALKLCVQACFALQAAHKAKVTHRDIKPANLFLTTSGILKLLDFGVAKAESEIDPAPDQGRSEALTVVGTPEYMAPEQATGKAADARSDVYALGAVLYELITGTLPHRASSTVLLLDSKLRTDPEPPSQRTRGAQISRMLDQTILRALSRHPDLRFQSAADFRTALEQALREPARIHARRTRIARIGAGVFASALVIGLVLGARQPKIRARGQALRHELSQRTHTLVQRTHALEERAHALLDHARSLRLARRSATAPVAAMAIAVQAMRAGPLSSNPQTTSAVDTSGADDTDEIPLEDSTSQQASQSPLDPMLDRLGQAEHMIERGRQASALIKLRELGRDNPSDPRVLRAWSLSAAKAKAWGEALRVARSWAEIDSGAEAQLHLARMQRVGGLDSEVAQTLTRLLEKHPECEAARQMLDSRGSERRRAGG